MSKIERIWKLGGVELLVRCFIIDMKHSVAKMLNLQVKVVKAYMQCLSFHDRTEKKIFLFLFCDL